MNIKQASVIVSLKIGLVGLFALFLGTIGFPKVQAQSQETQSSAYTTALAYGPESAYPDGIITSFESEVTIEPRGDGLIKERIIVYFPNERHGIFRWIPNRVTLEDGSTLNQPIKKLQVDYRLLPKNASETPDVWESNHETDTSEGGYLMIKIGDPDITYTGAVEYQISYTIKDLVRFLPDHQELFLNITGNGWDLPIAKTKATISPVIGLLDKACYTGKTGSTFQNCTMQLSSTDITVTAGTKFSPNEGMTVALKYPLGTFPGPTEAEKLLMTILIFAPFIMPVLAFAGAYSLWKQYGRDKPVLAIPPVYVPSTELRAAGFTTLKYLHDMQTSKVPVLAELIALAEKKLLTISYENKKITLLITPEQAEKLEAYLQTQPEHLVTMVTTLTDNFSESTTLNDLSAVYTDLARMDKQSVELFNSSQYIEPNSIKKRTVLIFFAVFAAVITFLAFILVVNSDEAVFFTWPFAGGISVAILAIFSAFMIKRSKDGDGLYLDILGIKKYIQAAELKRLEFFNDPKKMIAHFEELLPYSIILGLDKQWTRMFGPILAQLEYEPTWFVSNMPLYSIWPSTYSSMANSFSSITTKLATPPQSSSSGFGGGGFSGGGSGGGGGGSW